MSSVQPSDNTHVNLDSTSLEYNAEFDLSQRAVDYLKKLLFIYQPGGVLEMAKKVPQLVNTQQEAQKDEGQSAQFKPQIEIQSESSEISAFAGFVKDVMFNGTKGENTREIYIKTHNRDYSAYTVKITNIPVLWPDLNVGFRVVKSVSVDVEKRFAGQRVTDSDNSDVKQSDGGGDVDASWLLVMTSQVIDMAYGSEVKMYAGSKVKIYASIDGVGVRKENRAYGGTTNVFTGYNVSLPSDVVGSYAKEKLTIDLKDSPETNAIIRRLYPVYAAVCSLSVLSYCNMLSAVRLQHFQSPDGCISQIREKYEDIYGHNTLKYTVVERSYDTYTQYGEAVKLEITKSYSERVRTLKKTISYARYVWNEYLYKKMFDSERPFKSAPLELETFSSTINGKKVETYDVWLEALTKHPYRASIAVLQDTYTQVKKAYIESYSKKTSDAIKKFLNLADTDKTELSEYSKLVTESMHDMARAASIIYYVATTTDRLTDENELKDWIGKTKNPLVPTALTLTGYEDTRNLRKETAVSSTVWPELVTSIADAKLAAKLAELRTDVELVESPYARSVLRTAQLSVLFALNPEKNVAVEDDDTKKLIGTLFKQKNRSEFNIDWASAKGETDMNIDSMFSAHPDVIERMKTLSFKDSIGKLEADKAVQAIAAILKEQTFDTDSEYLRALYTRAKDALETLYTYYTSKGAVAPAVDIRASFETQVVREIANMKRYELKQKITGTTMKTTVIASISVFSMISGSDDYVKQLTADVTAAFDDKSLDPAYNRQLRIEALTTTFESLLILFDSIPLTVPGFQIESMIQRYTGSNQYGTIDQNEYMTAPALLRLLLQLRIVGSSLSKLENDASSTSRQSILELRERRVAVRSSRILHQLLHGATRNQIPLGRGLIGRMAQAWLFELDQFTAMTGDTTIQTRAIPFFADKRVLEFILSDSGWRNFSASIIEMYANQTNYFALHGTAETGSFAVVSTPSGQMKELYAEWTRQLPTINTLYSETLMTDDQWDSMYDGRLANQLLDSANALKNSFVSGQTGSIDIFFGLVSTLITKINALHLLGFDATPIDLVEFVSIAVNERERPAAPPSTNQQNDSDVDMGSSQ